MSWLQVSLEVVASEVAGAEAALLCAGAVALTMESEADEVVLEPAPGEVPLWNNIRLLALFPLQTDISVLAQALREFDRDIHKRLDIDFIAAQDWQSRLANHTVSAQFAERLWLLPKSLASREHATEMPAAAQEPSQVKLFLQPGLAFGSGSHPTTRLCLQWLAETVEVVENAELKVLDFGCGSGILGIAAALLGAKVVAIDHDDQAILATDENAHFNQVDDRVQALTLERWQQDRHQLVGNGFDLLVANILAAPLVDLAPMFTKALRHHGQIALSGILREQAEMVMAAYPSIKFDAPNFEGDWVCLTGTKA